MKPTQLGRWNIRFDGGGMMKDLETKLRRQGMPALLILGLGTLLLGAAGCRDSGDLKFGAVLPLSGERAIYGKPIEQGIQLALEDIRARPDSPEVELMVLDSAGDPEKGAAQLKELYQDGVRAVIGGVTSKEALAMVQQADEMNRVLLSPSATTPDLTGISRNFFRVWPSDFREGTKMGQYAAQTMGLKTAVILAAESEYARGIERVFRDAFEQNGGEMIEEILYPRETQDFGALVDRTIDLKPEAVYLADYAAAITRIVEMLKDRGFKGKILTVSAFAASEAIATAGQLAENVYVTHPQFTPTDVDNPKVVEFVKGYEAKYGEEPDIFAAHGYDAMIVAYEASQNGGDRAHSFWKGVRGLQDLQGVTGPLNFDSKGDVQKWPRVYWIVDGRLVDHEDYTERQAEELRKRLDDLRRQRQKLLKQGGNG